MWIYIFSAAVLLILIYCCVVMAYTVRLKQLAYLLRELLDGDWGDIMQIIRNEEYVEAVIRACKIVMEEAR